MGGLIIKEVKQTRWAVRRHWKRTDVALPIIFSHFCQAYIQGQHDPEYEDIIRAVTAITFLATPHRGSDFAKTLNRILQSTLLSTPKQYITDLSKNSFTLQKLNEQFRHIAPRLNIISFYETQPTSIGHKKARVVSAHQHFENMLADQARWF